MKVREVAAWLAAFHDQDADVEVVLHSDDGGYYSQGGTAQAGLFDPAEHADYTDMRGNPHVPPGAPYRDSRTLLLGVLRG